MSQQPSSNASGLVGQCMGKYELVALVARGGTAEIYLARIAGVAGFEKYVVVKLLHDHLADDNEFVHMFLDEARLSAQLDHSNIVQTLELGEEKGRYYIVMEYLAGMSLSLIARRVAERIPGGRLPVELVLGIASQACAGLHYAHQKTDAADSPLNIVHRDVSPQNLVVSFEGIVKLVDFGIAKAEMRETQTRSGTIKGKFAYMSPEQCMAGEVDHRTDVFALGIIVHELLTGRRLFKRQSTYETYRAIAEAKVPPPSAVNHELDPALDEVVMKALTYAREDRYPSAEAFGEAMTAILYKRGKAVTAGTVAAFFEKHFGKEINEHGARMRELIAGRQTLMDEQWDDPDASSDADDDFDGDFDDDLLPQDSASELNALDVALAAADRDAGLRPRAASGGAGGVGEEDDEAATRVELPDMDEELAETDGGADMRPAVGEAAMRHAHEPDPGHELGDHAPGAEMPTMALQVGRSKGHRRPDGLLPSPVDVVTGRSGVVADVVTNDDSQPTGLKETLLAMGSPPVSQDGAAGFAPPVPQPPVVSAPLARAAGRRSAAASDDFAMGTMKTEPAGPRGIMAARSFGSQGDDESPVEVPVDMPGREPAASPSYPMRVQQDHAGRADNGASFFPTEGRGRRFRKRGAGAAPWGERSAVVLPLWALAIIFVISAGLGLGATLLIADLL